MEVVSEEEACVFSKSVEVGVDNQKKLKFYS